MAGTATVKRETPLLGAARRARTWRRLSRSTWLQRAWAQAFANLEALLVRSRLHRSGSPSAGIQSELKARAWLMWVEALDLDLETTTGPDIGAELSEDADGAFLRSDANCATEDVLSASMVSFMQAEAEAEAEARTQARTHAVGAAAATNAEAALRHAQSALRRDAAIERNIRRSVAPVTQAGTPRQRVRGSHVARHGNSVHGQGVVTRPTAVADAQTRARAALLAKGSRYDDL